MLAHVFAHLVDAGAGRGCGAFGIPCVADGFWGHADQRCELLECVGLLFHGGLRGRCFCLRQIGLRSGLQRCALDPGHEGLAVRAGPAVCDFPVIGNAQNVLRAGAHGEPGVTGRAGHGVVPWGPIVAGLLRNRLPAWHPSALARPRCAPGRAGYEGRIRFRPCAATLRPV